MNANKLIEFKPTRRGMLLKLPYRSLGKAKIFGWLPVAFSLLPIMFAVNWLVPIFPVIFKGAQAGVAAVDIFMVAFAVVGLLPLWFGLKIFALGIAILRDRTYTSALVTKENLICYESFYGFSFKRKIPSQPIKQLVISQMVDPPEPEDGDPDSYRTAKTPEFIRNLVPDDLWGLSTTRKMGTGILLAYPKEIVAEAATLISKELDDIQFQLPSSRVTDDPKEAQTSASNARVKIIDTSREVEPRPSGGLTSSLQAGQSHTTNSPTISSKLQETSSPAEPPADSLLKVTHQDGTDVYEVPAQGWRKAAPLVWFAAFWIGFMFFATLMMVWGKPQNPIADVWEVVALVAFMCFFWAIGIGLAIWAWNSAKCSAMIGVTGEQMFIETKSIFGTKWVEYNQSEIHAISVQNSGASNNDVPIKHLVVETKDQPPLGLFANLSNEELHWLSGRLKGSLNFKWKNRHDISTAFNEDGDIIVPQSTRIKVDRGVGPTIVEVPIAPLGRLLGFLCFLILTLAFAVGLGWMMVQQGGLGDVLFPVLIGGMVVMIPIGCLIYCLRRWTIVASPEQLTVTRRWPLGTKELTFQPENIKKISIGTTGLKTGNQTHYQLVVDTHQERKAMTLMNSWDVKELKYVAATIYEALEMELTPAE